MRQLRATTGRIRARGTSMIEVLVAALILSLLLGAVGMTALSGSGAARQGIASADVEAQARRMVERIAGEFLDASSGSLPAPPWLPPWRSDLRYAPAVDYVAGALVTGPTRRLRLVLQPGELDDGLDNNGNGLTDECRVELLPDEFGAPGQVVGWGNFVREYLEGETPNGADDNGNGLVDERGLCLEFDDTSRVLTVRLTLERLDSLGRPLTRTVETAVQLRNE